MTEYYPDFFNDVFGPVMQPGSSSHTAGPCRIGYYAHMKLGEPLKDIHVILDNKGSFAGTFGLMNEEAGMLAGAYGLLPDDVRLFDIQSILSAERITYDFEISSITESRHINAVKFILTGRSGKKLCVVGNSTGGGMFEIVNVNGKNMHDMGDKAAYGILPVCAGEARRPQLFSGFSQWRQIAENDGRDIADVAVEYEQAASGWSREKILDHMIGLKNLMREQTEAAYRDEEGLLETGYSGFHFRKWADYEKSGSALCGPVIERALHYAYGVQAFKKNVLIVPGPMGTGGGFMYSALRAAGEAAGADDEAVLKGLFIAAAVGAVCYTRIEPTGEVTGCMGECGVCMAMTSAAVTEMMGGNPKQVEAAASLSLQSSFGWPCDPIPGGENQPCFSRFTTAVTMAVVFADEALSGRSAVLPFDEVADAVGKLGREMPDGLKCTARGGLCMTPTAERISREFMRQ